MKAISIVLAFVVCSFIIPATALSAKPGKKLAIKNVAPGTKWVITCPGESSWCYSWVRSPGMEVVEPGGPAQRVQVPNLTPGPGAEPANNIFLHTTTSQNIGLGYFPALVNIYTSTHSAHLEILESTVEYTNYSAWRAVGGP